MTGDGYLDTPERLQALVKYFEPHGRLAKVSVLQVMHHGSNKNWHKGVAATLSSDRSIFSSDPNHRGFSHPHRDVVEDFICYGPQQVNSRRGFSMCSVLWTGK
jgi:beta-lactamase superfamily II metal-dependent hydrolase